MSSYPSYIPAKDALFSDWLLNFSTTLDADPSLYGLTAADATAVSDVNTAFQDAYTLSVDPATRTSPTVAAKDNARASAEAVVRPYAVQISRNDSVTDEDKANIGVTIRSQTPTPIPPPDVAPELGIQSAIPLEMRMTYKVPGSAGKSKPFGSVGVEVWRSVGEVAATDPAQTTYNGQFTKSPFRQRFSAEEQGKVVTYFARFITRSGPQGEAQVGPWSAPLTLNVM